MANISKLGKVCKHYILKQQRKQKSGCATYPIGYIPAHKVLVWFSENATIDSKIFNWYKKKANRKVQAYLCVDIYINILNVIALSRRSGQKHDFVSII